MPSHYEEMPVRDIIIKVSRYERTSALYIGVTVCGAFITLIPTLIHPHSPSNYADKESLIDTTKSDFFIHGLMVALAVTTFDV